MSEIAIKATGLGKQFRIGARRPYKVLRESISLSFLGGGRGNEEWFWALNDVSFEVQRGEVIGVIGRNGAGKSTLLKILSRITDPSTGRVELYGRVGSLLEVGTGFHPELTGRENIYLNGAVLGMKRSEIRARFDQIVEFAEIAQFLDTPVKHYSSGMYMRLAFAVAAHLEPEIMVVDEVLAVGDDQFQKKCLGKMAEVAGSGRTVLFVSHNLGAVNRLCGRCMWLDAGRIAANGSTAEVVSKYVMSNQAGRAEVCWPEGIANPDVTEARMLAVRARNADGQISASLDVRKGFAIELVYEIHQPLPYCRVGFIFSTADGAALFDSYDIDEDEKLTPRAPGKFVCRCEVPADLLRPGTYFVTANIGMPNIKNLVWLENVLSLTIEDTGAAGSTVGIKRDGVIRPRLAWQRVPWDV